MYKATHITGTLLFLLSVVVQCHPATANDDDFGKEIYGKVLKSTAFISTEVGTGTGWIIDKTHRLLVTNFHVVARQESVKTEQGINAIRDVVTSDVQVVFPVYVDGKVIHERSFYAEHIKRFAVAGRVLFTSSAKDLAVIQVNSLPDSIQQLTLASREPSPGDTVHSIGNPGASDALWVYTSGTVRSVHEKKRSFDKGYSEYRIVETQSPVNRGDSGGPIVNDDGEVVAVVQSYTIDARLVSNNVAVAELRRLMRRNASLVVGDTNSGANRISRAKSLYDQGKYNLAIADLDAAIGKLKGDKNADAHELAYAYKLRGTNYGHTFRWKQAIADYNEAIRIDPSGLYYYDRALCHYQAEDNVKTVVDCNKALGHGYDNPKVYQARGRAYLELKKYDWAIADFDTALNRDPGFSEIFYTRGKARYLQAKQKNARFGKDIDRAVADFRAAIRRLPASHWMVEEASKGLRYIENFRRR